MRSNDAGVSWEASLLRARRGIRTSPIMQPVSRSDNAATRAVVGADCEKADGVYLKRPPPAQAPCPRANPGLHLATLPASGRVALGPRRSAVTRDRKSTRLNSSHLVISYA